MTLEESSAETLVAAAPMAEAPAEEDWLTGAADGDRAGAALDQNPTMHAQNVANPVGRAFLVLRVASVVSILCAFGVLFALETSQSSWQVWAGTGGFLVYLAFAAEVLLRWTQRRVQKERTHSTELFMERQAKLQDIASRDDLTQLQNRRVFYGRLQEELETAERTRRQLSVIMIDVDDLKAINDEFGHQVGDVILRQFGRALNRTAGPKAVTARLGGDEFAVIMPNADRRQADQMAWKIWDQLNAAPLWENGHASIYLGVSIGIGGYPWGGTDLEEVIHWADAKLYANKLERKGFDRGRRGSGDNRLSSAVVEVLSTALDIRDKMTHRHARRVARMAAAVAREMGLSEQQVLEIEYAAALHDIGKIGVADSILRKAAPLDEAEWKDMRRHSELGYEILKGIDFLRDAAEIVWAHHERCDGRGYPRGLAKEEIPLGARVFGVVDAYDAMTSRRPYRQAMSRDQACIEIEGNSGTQFDPAVVEAFLVMVRRSPEGMYEENDSYGPTTKRTQERERQAAAVESA
ncbi:MAG: diguanylate cyclase [Dehalococcoidia bacterium]|nr:diguanylate cyclase [Dehalococcoidia bacterium]